MVKAGGNYGGAAYGSMQFVSYALDSALGEPLEGPGPNSQTSTSIKLHEKKRPDARLSLR